MPVIEADVLLEGWGGDSLTGGGEVQLPVFEALMFVGGRDWVGSALRLLGAFMQRGVSWVAKRSIF